MEYFKFALLICIGYFTSSGSPHWIHFLFVTGCPVDILIDLSEPAASVIDEDQEDKENTAPFTATGKYAKTETKPS